jgi:hypothetical protein
MRHLAATLPRGLWSATLAVAVLAAACGPGGSLPATDGGAGEGGPRDGQSDVAVDAAQNDAAQADAADAPIQDDAPPQQDAQSDTIPPFGCYGFLINEFQTQGTSDNDEFIEIAGPVGGDLSPYRLFYREAAGTSDVSLIAFSSGDVIPASGFVIIASNGWVGGDAGVQAFRSYLGGTTGKLATTGGGLALRQGTGTIIDSVGYGNATNIFVQGSPTAAPPVGKSSSRSPRCKSTGNNSADFSWTNPTPGH